MRLKFSQFFALLLFPFALAAQSDNPPQNWFLMDSQDGFQGVSAERTYKELLADKKGRTVVVAVIDSGVDVEHEDLRDVVWTNTDEIPGNGIDDDRNGYVDDVHGWNFLGNADGTNVNEEQLEVTRLLRFYRQKFDGMSEDQIKGKKAKRQYALYQKIEKEVSENRDKNMTRAATYEGILKSVDQISATLGKPAAKIMKADMMDLKTDDEMVSGMATRMASQMDDETSLADIRGEIEGAYNYFYNQAMYYYNPDINPREAVGDNYADSYEKGYGNPDPEGPDAMHGTHVAGIIAATRGNKVGMDGVADNVQIMSIRAVPDGDEHDKDVANAILYAVDNGASIINMSFGKGYGWDKEAVDKAVKYAEKNDVLLVHAAGNSSQNNDNTDNFPNDGFVRKGFFGKLFGSKYADNWIEVGALNFKQGEDTPAPFSNYGKENVDLFAPGVKIYATVPGDEYAWLQGTSMASPVVAGTAAMLRSYYPTLTAAQVKEILMDTTVPLNVKVKQPGTDEMVNFSDLSVSGGVVNVYRAVQKAETTKGKKKGVSMDNARP